MPGKRRKKYDWSKYNKELVERGQKLANKISEIRTDVIEFWNEELKQMNDGKEGARYEYPNSQIVFLSVIRSAFNINSYRNLQGLARLFFDSVPDFTRIQRRFKQLDLAVIEKINKEVIKTRTEGRKLEIAMDGTGVQINGKYVWVDKKVKKIRKRNWKKISIVIDIETKQILGVKILKRSENEGSHRNTEKLMNNAFSNISDTSEIVRVFGDGGFDNEKNFEMFQGLSIEPIIRIKKKTRCIAKFMNNTKVKEKKRVKYFSKRRNREAVMQYYWDYFVELFGYGKRSGVEGIIGSIKRFFRENLFSKMNDTIEREIMTRILIWNMIV